MKLATMTKAAPDLPTVSLLADPEYRRQAEKLDELENHARALEDRRSRLGEALSQDVAAAALRDARARALIDDGVVPLARDVEHAAIRRDLAAIVDELPVVRRAVEMQRAVVQQERARVSRVICDRLRPQHRAIIARIARALAELAEAAAAEHDFRRALVDADVDSLVHLRPMPLGALGLHDPRSEHSAAALWLREAREHGLLEDPR